MVLEFADPPTVCLPEAVRMALRLTQQPLPGWAVFLGRNSDTPVKFYHQTFGIPENIMASADATTRLNTHITTFTIGSVLIQTMSSQVAYFDKVEFPRQTYCQQLGLEQAWPIESKTMRTPTQAFDDENFVVKCQFWERIGFFGATRSGLCQAIDRGFVSDPQLMAFLPS